MCVGAYVCVVCADSLRSVPQDTISPKIITVLTRYRPIVLELR